MPKTLIGKLTGFLYTHKILFLILVVTFLVRLPSLFEPLWYKDEAIYLTVGQKILRGGLPYLDIFDHKTPGIYYLTALAIKTLGASIWSLRVLLTGWMLVTLIVFFFLGKKLFDTKTALIGVFFLSALTSTPLLEGNITNSELLMILLTSVAIILGLKNRYFFSGVFFSLAVLIKAPALFDFSAFFLFVVFSTKNLDFKALLKTLKPLALGFLLPLTLSAVFFAFHGALLDYFKSAFLFNISYTSYKNSFLFSNSLLVVKALPVFALVLFFALRTWRRLKSRVEGSFSYFDFLVLWLAFSFYGAVFGGRLYNHYLIQVVPAFCLLAAYLFSTTKKRFLGIFVLSATIILALCLRFTPVISPSYYPNFFKYVFNDMSFKEYSDSFDSRTSQNYSLAGFLKASAPDGSSLYLFSNQSPIYFLSSLDPASKYITFFHIAGDNYLNDEVARDLNEIKPYYILAEKPRLGAFPQLESILQQDYNLVALYENVEIYKNSKLDKKPAF